MLITQNLRRAAQVNHDGVAVCDASMRRSWGEMADRVPRIAAGLRALGLAPGDRIAVLANNVPAFHELYFAAPWAGLVMASLNTRWSAREMVEALADCGAVALLVDTDFLHLAPALREGAPRLRTVIGATAGGDIGWEALAGAPEPMADNAPDADAPAYLFYTGGTTGRSKGVMLSARNFYVAGLSSLHTAGIGPQSMLAVTVPLFHMSGGGLIAAQMASACGVRLVPRFEPEAAMAAVAASAATHVIWVPTMLNMILASPALGSHDLGSLRRIIYGSAPMPPTVLDRAMQALPDVRFTQYYGMTEVTGNATFLGPEAHERPDGRLRSVGMAVPGVEIRVVRADGSLAGVDEVGEICVRGPTVTAGYWDQPDKTAEAIRDGWMHTGDLGRRDADGYVFIVDRLKDMIISGGENVYSSEVEAALYRHPDVRECAVVGMPDETWGEVVCAVVNLAAGSIASPADLVAHCRGHIGGFKLPRRIVLLDEPLPKSAAGKILKTELRKQFVPPPSPARAE